MDAQAIYDAVHYFPSPLASCAGDEEDRGRFELWLELGSQERAAEVLRTFRELNDGEGLYWPKATPQRGSRVVVYGKTEYLKAAAEELIANWPEGATLAVLDAQGRFLPPKGA